MPYMIDWYIENEIIYIEYSEIVTADELRESLLKTMHLIDSCTRPMLHVIANVGDVTEPLAVKESLQIVREVGTHERLGWQITLHENSILVKMGIAFGTTIFKTRARTFDNMGETIEFLKTMDKDLHWEDVNPSLVIN